MMARKGRLAAGLVLLPILLMLGVPAGVVASTSPCTALPDPQWPGQCFAPAQVKQAEKSLEVPPVPARAIVEGTTHLRLKQVEVLETEVPNPGVPRNYVLHYFFGALPHDPQGAPIASGQTPHYVLVSEFAGKSGIQSRHVARDIGQLRAFHVPPGGGFVPWTLSTDVPSRDITLYVTSNISAKTVREIASQLIAKGSRRTH